MLAIDSFLSTLVLLPMLALKKDGFVVLSLSLVFLLELVLFARFLYKRRTDPHSTVLLEVWSLSKKQLVTLAASAIAFYLLCLILFAAFAEHHVQATQNLIFVSVVLETLFMGRFGVQLLRSIFSKRADKIGNVDNLSHVDLPDFLIVLYILPRSLRRIAAAFLVIFLPILGVMGSVPFFSDYHRNPHQLFILSLVFNAFYFASFLLARANIPYHAYGIEMPEKHTN